MIVPRTSREEILGKLRAKVVAHDPIFIASAGNGLVAKLLEKAGVDCINTFSGARLRGNGMGTMSMMWPILDSNKQTLDYTEQDIKEAARAFTGYTLNRGTGKVYHNRRQWDAGEKTAMEQLAPVFGMIPDIDRWPLRDRRSLLAAIRARGRNDDMAYARSVAANRRLGRAIRTIFEAF